MLYIVIAFLVLYVIAKVIERIRKGEKGSK